MSGYLQTPYTTNNNGQGPAWANSLFEDNAEFDLGFDLTLQQHKKRVSRLLDDLTKQLPITLSEQLKDDSLSIEIKHQLINQLQSLLSNINTAEAQQLSTDVHHLLYKSVWIIGSDS